jgi:hypothetical protein
MLAKNVGLTERQVWSRNKIEYFDVLYVKVCASQQATSYEWLVDTKLPIQGSWALRNILHRYVFFELACVFVDDAGSASSVFRLALKCFEAFSAMVPRLPYLDQDFRFMQHLSWGSVAA